MPSTPSVTPTRTRRLTALIVVTLLVLHQDLWFWDDATLLFGFLPVGLAWHALCSILCAVAWGAVVVFAWPHHLDDEGDATADEAPG